MMTPIKRTFDAKHISAVVGVVLALVGAIYSAATSATTTRDQVKNNSDAIAAHSTQISNLNKDKADKTELDRIYTKLDKIDDKLDNMAEHQARDRRDRRDHK